MAKKYKSPLEENTAKQLQGVVKFEYEPLTLSYTIPTKTHKYTPDFWIQTKKGDVFVIECKGGGPRYGLTEDTKQKMLLVKEQHPNWLIRFCFQNAKLKTGQGKGKPKITYGEWAELNGFEWCEKIIPKHWIGKNK